MVASRKIIPSRSYHQEASGLPMISLTLSSSSSGSMGRRNGRINSKLITLTSQWWKPSVTARLPRVRRSGLCGRPLSGLVILLVVFRAAFLSAIELENRIDPNLGDGFFFARLLAVIFPGADLAFHLDVSSFGQRGCELGELPEDDATVPFGVRDIFALLLVLVGGLGGQREGSKAAVVGIADFCIFAEEADEDCFVLVHDCVSVC